MRKTALLWIGIILVIAGRAAGAADHPWQVGSTDGNSVLYVGFLAQGQAEGIWTPNGKANSKDLFLRRFRLMAGGRVNSKLSFFVETDSPNLGKGTSTGSKGEDRIFIQDAFFTYRFRQEFQVDAGMMLLALSHNYGQSAASLLAVDYGPYTFLASEPTGSRYGRDYGVQARGYLFRNHLEYRAGVFQGSRAPTGSSASGASNPFRTTGRVAWYPFEADTGFFYTGTFLGTKKVLSVGASFDHQMEYNSRSLDFFYDQPLGHGDGITLQADYTFLDGKTAFPQLPKEHVWFAEAGYYNRFTRLGPFLQLSNRLYTNPLLADTRKYLGGIAFWGSGHRLNLKLGVGRSLGSPSGDSWQVVLQGQAYIF